MTASRASSPSPSAPPPEEPPILPDPLLALAPPAVQRSAARSAQDAFTEAFTLSLEADPASRTQRLAASADTLLRWSGEAESEARALRQALLLSALDQWGLAWSQAFGGAGLNGLAELVGHFRAGLDPVAEAACQAAFERLNADEGAAFTFKAEVRKAIHLALWHAMIAEPHREAATGLLQTLGGMMLAVDRTLPLTGWLIVAGTLADIRIRSERHQLATSGLGQELTQELSAALARELPPERRQRLFAAAAHAARIWQAAA